MAAIQETTLLVLSGNPVEVRVASALQSAAKALGYVDGCQIACLEQVEDVRLFVFESDPWCVLAIDDEAADALRAAFGLNAVDFSADLPAHACGYILIAVPGFVECLDDAAAKRIAWNRMKAAVHPGNPLD